MRTNRHHDNQRTGTTSRGEASPPHIQITPKRSRNPRHRRRVTLLMLTPLLLIASAAGALLTQASAAAEPNHVIVTAPSAAACTPQSATITVNGISVAAATSAGAQAAQLAARLTTNCALTGLVDFAVYNAGGTLVYQTWLSNAAIATTAQTFSTLWTLPTNLANGAYALDLGVFTADWQQELTWVENGATFQVANGRVTTPTSSTPVPTTPPSATATPTQHPTNTPAPTNTAAPTKAPASTPSPSPTATHPSTLPTPPKGGALAPGATLPTEAQCTAAIAHSTWEPRPSNTTADHSVPTASQIAGLAPWDGSLGYNPRADALRKSITGNYTGTTDMILQWVACKWGIDPNIVRAQAVVESTWQEGAHGDLTSTKANCPPGAATSGSSCYQSYGILQVKWMYNKSAWPMSRDDTAFSAEYAYGLIRNCYEGNITWLSNGYKAGDIWGCLGYWYSGGWYTADAQSYINNVKSHFNSQDWLKSGF